jgi:hypothetical protein
MELWIRSQNKGTLMKPEILDQTDGIIKAYFSNGNVKLGTYKNVERALEVLDEIQNLLKPRLKIVQTDDMSLPIITGEWENSIREKYEYDIKQLSTYVYEMPKE